MKDILEFLTSTSKHILDVSDNLNNLHSDLLKYPGITETYFRDRLIKNSENLSIIQKQLEALGRARSNKGTITLVIRQVFCTLQVVGPDAAICTK